MMNNQKMCAIAIAVFFISLYSLFCIGHYAGDGYQDFLTAESIVLNHSLAFNDNSYSNKPHDMDELKKYEKDFGVKGRDGRMYNSRGGIVIPIMLSSLYFIGHIVAGFFKSIPHFFITMFFVSFLNPIISAMNCLLIFFISLNLSFSKRMSIVLTLIYGLATMVPVYLRAGFGEPAMTLFMLLAIYFILRYKNSIDKKYLILTAIMIGLMIFTRAIGIILLPPFIIYTCLLVLKNKKYTTGRLQDAVIFAVTLLVILALIGIYNYAIYGGFLKFGNRDAEYMAKSIVDRHHPFKGLYYYLLSSGKSFFLFNLPLLLSFVGLVKISPKRKKEIFLFLGIFLFNLVYSSWTFRRGSLFSWGPRYLYPSVAVLIFLIGDFYENNKNRIGRWSILVLSVVGFLIMAPCMFINQSKFYSFVTEKLNLPEYMINFVPDLSPIGGAWKMFTSHFTYITKGIDVPFVYAPDRTLPAIASSMAGYNNFDFWFLKIISLRSEYNTLVFGLIVFMSMILIGSLACIIRSAYLTSPVKD